MFVLCRARRTSGLAALAAGLLLATGGGCFHVSVVMPDTLPTDSHRLWVRGFFLGRDRNCGTRRLPLRRTTGGARQYPALRRQPACVVADAGNLHPLDRHHCLWPARQQLCRSRRGALRVLPPPHQRATRSAAGPAPASTAPDHRSVICAAAPIFCPSPCLFRSLPRSGP